MINLTPHVIVLRGADGSEHSFPPSGTVARVSTTDEVVDYFPIYGVEVVTTQYGEVTGLPDEDVPCLVSAMVLERVKNRKHVYAPDTGSTAVRNDSGQVVAVTRLKTVNG